MSLTVKNTRYPAVNPVRCVPLDSSKGTGYNTYPTDRGLYLDSIRPDKVVRQYHQKFLSSDTIAFYLDDLAIRIFVSILDAAGNLYNGGMTVGMSATAVVDGNVLVQDGVTYQYNSYYYSFKPSQAGFTLPDGVYRLYIESYYADGSTFMVSEPLLILSAGMANTRLLEYTNSTNEQDVFFEQVLCYFAMRIEGDLLEPKPASYTTAFTDQIFTQRVVNDFPYRVFDFMIGGGAGVPAYITDRVNRALCCDTFAIDKVRYVKDAGANIAITEFPQSPLKMGIIKLQEADNTGGWVFPTPYGTIIYLLDLPIDSTTTLPMFPVGITTLGMKMGGITVNTPSVVLNSLTDVGNWINYLNGTFLPSLTPTPHGHYDVVGVNRLVYVNSPEESYIPNLPGVFAFTQFFDLTVLVTFVFGAGGYSYIFACRPGGLKGLLISDWGDGAITTETNVGGGASTTVQHSYTPPSSGSTSTKTVRVFHNGASLNPNAAVGDIELYNSISQATAINADSRLPAGLFTLKIEHQNINPTYYPYGLDDVFNSIRYFSIANSNITNANANIFQIGTFGSQLLHVDISGNNFSQSTLNNIILAFSAHGTFDVALAGQFICGGQTTGVTPTGAALAFLNNLVSAYGWTVTY